MPDFVGKHQNIIIIIIKDVIIIMIRTIGTRCSTASENSVPTARPTKEDIRASYTFFDTNGMKITPKIEHKQITAVAIVE